MIAKHTSILLLALLLQLSVEVAYSRDLYTNALTNQETILADFDDYSFLDPGVGSFQADPAYGLQLLSAAPNSYHGIKIKKEAFPKTVSLQAQVFSRVSNAIDPTQSQTNPNYAAGIYFFKYATNSDGSPDFQVITNNFVKIELARNLDFEGTQQYLHYRFDSEGRVLFDDYIPLGSTDNLTLRINYSAADGRISFSYSGDGNTFTNCPVIFAGWNSNNFDGILLGALATSIPFTTPGQPTPQATYSVKPGQVYMRDLRVSSTSATSAGDFLLSLERSTNNLSSWFNVPMTAEMLNSEGKLIVPKSGTNTNSFFRMRIQPVAN
jgi:hypothetical protein